MIGAWLYHCLGLAGTGPVYGFWSGFGSDVSEFTLLGLAYGAYRKHNCHGRRCWRIGRHVVNGTPWCNRHHQEARKGSADGQAPDA